MHVFLSIFFRVLGFPVEHEFEWFIGLVKLCLNIICLNALNNAWLDDTASFFDNNTSTYVIKNYCGYITYGGFHHQVS